MTDALATNLTATTISTIAVQTGRTRIVLAVLKHKDELHLRVQEMEPGIADIGKSLEEAISLAKEHNECLAKLAAKQPNVEELLAQADDLIITQQPKREVYGAMADSLGQAWRDLNDLLEYRRLLLERAIAFHQKVEECNQKITETQKEMEKVMDSYTGSAKDWLQENTMIRKDILESSMRLLGEAQALVEFINDLRRIPAADSRGYDHATTAACHIVEELLEKVHDRRKRLEELWQRRRQQLLSHQNFLSLQQSMEKLRKLFEILLAADKKFTTIGSNLPESKTIWTAHQQHETSAKEIYDSSLQLRRLHAQISPCPPEVDREFQQLVDQIEKTYLRIDRRRFVLSLTVEFYEKYQSTLTIISQTDQALNQMDTQKEQIKPQDLVARQKELLDSAKFAAAPVFHEGQMLLERVETLDAGGVEHALRDLQNALNALTAKCAALQSSLAKRGEVFRKFTEIYTSLYEWTVHVVEVLLKAHRILPPSLNGAKDFLDLHEQLYDEMRTRDSDFEALMTLVAQITKQPAGLDPAELKEVAEKSAEMKTRWSDLESMLKSRLDIVLPYAEFQKVASRVSAEVDVLRSISNLYNEDPSSELHASNFEHRLTILHDLISALQQKAGDFFTTTPKAPAAQVDVSQAAAAVNSTLERLQEDLKNFANITKASQSMRQKRTVWREIVEEVHQTITWIIKTEREAFQGLQLGYLGANQEETDQLRSKLSAFEPTLNEVRSKVDRLVQTAKAPPVDAETASERDMVVNDLTKAYERFVQRIEEYKVLLKMASEFYGRVNELEKLMFSYENMINTSLPGGVEATEQFIHRHSEQREHITRVYEDVVHMGDVIINRIRQNYPQSIDLDTFHKSVKDKRATWDRIWNQQNLLLQNHLNVMKLRKDGEELRQRITDLTDQLNRRKEEMGESLQGAKRIQEIQTSFTQSVETISTQVKNYVSTVTTFVSTPEAAKQFPDIRPAKDEVEKLWSTFYRDVGAMTKRTELAVNFYEKLEEAEQWYKEATQALVTIGRKTTECKGPEDANNVLSQMEHFLGPGEKRQEERVKSLMEISLQVFGQKGPSRVEYLIKKNRDVMESFSVISNELFSIAENLHSKTVKLTRSKSNEELEAGQPPTKTQKLDEHTIPVVHEKPVAAPAVPVAQKAQLQPARFEEQLHQVDVPAGKPAEFRCRVVGLPVPVVRWFRDGMPISNNPDYRITFDSQTGECALKIEETFPEDTGLFSCSAENSGGLAVSEARLNVLDEEMPTAEMTPPVFLKTPQDATAVEGSGLQFECQVIGNPRPTVTWYKNGIAIVPGKTKLRVLPPNEEGTTQLIIPAASVEDQGVYECKALNPRGVATCSITFTAPTESGEQSPFFTKLLTNQIGELGELVKLECHVSGVPAPDIEWLQNGAVLHDSRNRVIKFDGKIATCVIFEYSPPNAGTYVCKARNKLGEAVTTCIVDAQLPSTPVVPRTPEHTPERADLPEVKPEFQMPLLAQTETQPGQQVRLEAIIKSQPEATVTWTKNNNVVIVNANTTVGKEAIPSQPFTHRHFILIDKVTASDVGPYACVAKNSAGESRSHTVVLLPPSPPQIPEAAPPPPQKTSQVTLIPSFPQILPESLEFSEGQLIKLETTVISQPAAEVQWFKNGVLLTPSAQLVVGREKLQQNPETDRLFIVINSPTVDDQGEYVCLARNSAGEAKAQCTVSVKEKPKGPEVPPKPSVLPFKPEFARPLPNHVEVSDTEPLRLEAIIEAQPESAVQWYRNGNVVVADVDISLGKEPLSTNPQVDRHYLIISNPLPVHSGQYVCVAKNPEGETKTTCNVKIHTKVPPPVPPKPPKPEFRKNLPQNVDVQPGNPLRLEAIVSSVGEPQVQWRKNGNVVLASVDILMGEEPAKVSTFHHDLTQPKESRCFLEIKNPKPEHSGEYVCTAKNDEGETTTRCVVVVNEADVASVARTETHVKPAPPTLPKPLHDATVTETTVQNMPPGDEGYYKNTTVTRIEETNVVRYEGAPPDMEAPRFTELSVDHTVEEGHSLQLKCSVSGTTPLEIKWFKDDVEIPKHADYLTRYNQATGECVLEIPEVFAEDAGVFMIQAVNQAGIGKCYCNLKVADLIAQPSMPAAPRVAEKPVLPPPQFLQLFHDTAVEEGGPVRLECTISGPQCHVQWLKDGVVLNSIEYDIRNVGQKHSLTIPYSRQHDSGRYVCQADNSQGKATCSAQINVKPVEKQPEPRPPHFPPFEKTFVRETPEISLPPPVEVTDVVEEREKVTETYARPFMPPSPPQVMPKPVTVPVTPKKWVPPSLEQEKTFARVEQAFNLTPTVPDYRPVPLEKPHATQFTTIPQEPVREQPVRPIIWSPHAAPAKNLTEFVPSAPVPFVPPTELTPPTYTLKLLSRGVKPGEKVVFEARVVGSPTPEVTWFRENVPIKNSTDFRITHHGDLHQLTIPEAFPADAGHYKIRAVNPAGESICIAELVILQPGQILRDTDDFTTFTATRPVPVSHTPTAGAPHFVRTLYPQHITERNRVVLECELSGAPGEPVTVQWFRNSVEIQPSTDYQQKFKNGICTLVIPEAYPEDSGEYTCRATNSLGSRSSTGFLTVEPSLPTAGPKIAPAVLPKQQPVSQFHTVQPLQSAAAAPHYDVVKPKKPNIQSSNVSYRNAVSDHSDVDMGDAGLGIYSPLSNRQQALKRPALGQAHTSSGSDFVPDAFEKRLLTESQYRESSFLSSTELRPESRGDMNGYGSGGMEPPRFIQVIAPVRVAEGAEVQLYGRVSGNPRPIVSWLKNGQRLPAYSARHVYHQDGDYVGLTVRMALKEDAGNYTAIAENPVGQDACSATVTIDHRQQPVLQRVNSQPDLHRQQSASGIRHRDSSLGPRQHADEGTYDKSMAPRFVSVPPEAHIKEGQMFRLDCRVSGRPYPDVIWFRNGVEVLDDWTHKLIVNESGAHSLMITHAMLDDGGQYRCVARNISGETQFVVNVTVEESDKLTAPSFVQKLINQQVKEGEPVTLQARAIGMPAPTITWHKGAVEIFSGPEYRIDTRNGVSTLVMDNATLGDSDWYQCHARNSVGTSSTKAKVTVEALPRDLIIPGGFYVPRVPRREEQPPQQPETYRLRPSRQPPSYMGAASAHGGPGGEKPSFTSLLNDLELYEGDRAHFETCLIPIGDQTLRVEWYHNGQLIPSDSRHIFGNNFGFVSLDILNLTTSDAGVYTCRAINAAGEAQQTATLRCYPRQNPAYNQQFSGSGAPVYQQPISGGGAMPPFKQKGPALAPKPKFAKQLKNLDGLPEGSVAVFEAQIEPADDQLMKVEWFRNGQTIQMSERFDMKYMFGRAVLTIKQLRPEDSGMYMVKAHNGAGDVRSSATLRVEPEQSGRAVGTHHSSTNIKQTYNTSSSIVPQYDGYNGYNQVSSTHNTSGYDGYDKVTRTTTTKTVYNSSLSVQPAAPTFMRHLEPDYNVLEGSRLHMEVRATGQGDDLVFTWLKNGQPVHSDNRVRTSFAEGYAAIDILTVYPEDAGVYTLRVANAAGEAFTSTTLHCIPAPQPYPQPRPAPQPQPQPPIQRHVSQQETRTQTTTNFDRQVSSSKTASSAAQVQPTAPGQAPVFTQPLHNATAKQGAPIHLESRLIPVGDSTLTVLWYKDGQPLQAGARFKTTNDWGHVALDIIHSYPEDTGVYTCRAINAFGEAAVNCKISVAGEKSISYESSTAANLENIQHLEDWSSRDIRPREVTTVVLPPKLLKPLRPEQTMPEGKSAHFECQIQPTEGIQVEWYKNGQPVTASSRIRTVCDFGFIALDIIGVRPDDAGDWVCVIKNKAGQVETRTRLNVLNEASMLLGTDNPDRLVQLQHLEEKRVYSQKELSSHVERPQFRTPLHNHTNLVEGTSVHLETRLTPINEPTQKVEWFHNGRPLLDGSRIKTVNDFGFVALDISNLHPGDSGLYMVKATNAAGEAAQTCQIQVLSEKSILTQPINAQSLSQIQRFEDVDRTYHVADQVTPSHAPRFLSQIKSQDIPEDQHAHFECRLEPINDSKLKVEWYKDGQPLQASHRFKTTHDFGYVALHIVGATAEDTGRYTVVAHNQLGRIDQSADLLVRGKKTISFETQNPEGLHKIQQLEAWRSSTHREPIAQDAPSLAPRFVQPLRTQRSDLSEGQQAHFEARLENVDSNTRVEWFHNGRPVPQGSRYRFINDFGYVALTIGDLRADDAGEYVVRAYNDKGEDVTAARITVLAKKSLLTDTLHANSLGKIQQLESYDAAPLKGPDERPNIQRPVFTVPFRNLELTEGDKLHLESRLIPVGCKVEWFHNERPIDVGSRFGVTNDFGFVALDIADIRPEDAGTYTCRATNELGQAVATCSVLVRGTKSMYLETAHPEALQKLQALESYAPEKREEAETKHGKPVFTIPLQANVEIGEGEPLRLHCQLVPVGDPTLQIAWFFNGVPLRTGSRFLHVNEFGHIGLDLSAAYPEDSGLYTVRATNAAGEAVTSTSVRCLSKASLLTGTLHPESLPRIQQLEEHPPLKPEQMELEYGPPRFVTTLQNVDNSKEHSSAHFECRLEPSRDPTMKVEWFHNGLPLPAANRNRLTQDFGFVALDINQLTEADSGVYMARAFNKHGEAFTSARLICQGSKGVQSAAQTSDMALQRIAVLEDANRATFTSESKMFQPEEGGMAPRFTSTPKDLLLKENDMAHIHCNVTPTNDSSLEIMWFRNGQPLHASSRIKTLNDFGFVVLEISGIQTEDSGQYVCMARNRYGQDRVSCTIQCSGQHGVQLATLHPESLPRIQQLEELPPLAAPEAELDFGPPRFVTTLNNVDDAVEGATAHFECRLEPSRDPTMKVDWFLNGRPLPAANRNRLTQDFGFVALDINQVTEDDSGVYMARAYNKHGEAFTSSRLTCRGTKGVYSAAQTSEMALQRIAQLEDANRATFTSESKLYQPDEFGQAPRFTTTPKDLSLKEGDVAHVHCNVTPTNDSTLEIMWFKNGQPLHASSRMKTLSDFGFIVLEINGIQTEDSGQYVCIARNKFGEDRVTFTIQCSGKRGVMMDTQHPESLEKIRRLEEPEGRDVPQVPDKPKVQPKILNPLQPQAVLEGSPVHFETRITPTDDVDMVIEWFINGRPLRAGHRVRTINDFGYIALDILYVRREDFGKVTCRVHNSLGVDEASTTLSPLGTGPQPAPQFTTPLQNISNVQEGENIHLQATLEPAKDPKLSVEWYWNGKPIIHGSRVKTIHDFGFVVLEISPVYGEDSGTYTAVARNEAGEAVTSSSVTVESKKGLILDSQLPSDMRDSSIQKIQQIESASMHTYIPETGPVGPTQPPRFVSSAHDVDAKEGGMAHFELRFEPANDNTVTIEWFHNGRPVDVGSRFRTINDFGFIILEIKDLQARDAGVYTCVARNPLGEARSEVNLRVQTFKSVVLESSQPASLQKVQELEQQMQSAHIPAFVPEQPDVPPRFISQLDRQVELQEGDMAHFEAKIEPTNALVEWYRNGRPIVTGSRIRSINDFGFVVLEINGVTAEDSGQYTCRAKTSVGAAETSTDLKVQSKKSVILESQMPGGVNMAKLRELETPNAPLPEEKPVVRMPPKFITQLNPHVPGEEGDCIHIDCRVEPMDCQIEWYFNGHPLRSGHRFKLINDFGYVSLDILSVYAEDSGEYVARAVNELGQDITRCTITITAKENVVTRTQLPAGMEKGVERLEEIERELLTKGPIPYEVADQSKQRSKPEFTVKPRPVTIEEGETAKFECKVAGYPRPRVSWMLNGQLIISGSSRFKISFDGYMNVLEIPKARQYDGGEIAVIAQNPEGTAQCVTTLTITTKSDYRSVLKQSTSARSKVPVPDAFQSHLEKSQTDQQQGTFYQVDLQSVRRPGGAPPQQPQRQTSTDITIDFKQQQQTQWQQQQPPKPPTPQTPTTPQVAPKPFGQFNQNVNITSNQTSQFVPPSTPPVAPKPQQPPPQFTSQTSTTQNFQQQQQINLQQRPLAQPAPVQQNQFVSQSTQQQQQQQTTQQQQFNQQITVQQQQQPPVVPPKQPATPPPKTAGPPWMRQGSVKQETEQPAWVKKQQTQQQTSTVAAQSLPPRAIQTTSVSNQHQHGQMVESIQQEDIDITRKRYDESQQRPPQRPIPTASEDKEMSASEMEYTQRLQKGNLTEIRYVQQRERSESSRRSVQKMVAPGQGPPPADMQAPKFTQRLEPCRVSEGKSGHFTCKFIGKPVPRIEWYRENFQINPSQDFQITTTNDTSTLFMPEVYLEDSGNFTVKALNEGGMSQSTANLIVEEAYSGESSGPTPPSFSDTIHDTKVKLSDVVRLEVRVHGSAPISISWFKNGQKLQPSPRLKHVRDNDLHQLLILDALAEDSGWYDCVAVNEGGEARCSAQVTVEVVAGAAPPRPQPQQQQQVFNPVPTPPKPTSANPAAPQVVQSPENVTVYEGESATFRASIVGTPQPEVRWFKGHNVIKNSKYFRTFVSGNVCTLVITEAFHEDEGEYRCVARSPAGETTCSAFLKVLGDASSRFTTVTYQSATASSQLTSTMTMQLRGTNS
ncbi:LOW QUALITY PROTEIN: titin-like [Paramacrobiotus metropolitanus]|uniref:LOW QUALITY PROTEIN: titin-like n=1 Tax=Paramacrobiotus metropolitanus TaxID=2943436 RepID=UPI002445972E|nr:LOW QUALITY PROTEIN: titin-like [Paramacrobiotus metropolitanus]